MIDRLELMAEPFAARGFEATRIEDLAEATGIPKATLYYHFSGKEEILAWLLMRVLGEFRAATQEATEGPGSARDCLARVVKAELVVMAAHPVACRVLLNELGRAGRIPETATAITESFHVPVRRVLEGGLRDGSLPGARDPETLASAIFGAVTLTGLHYLLEDRTLNPTRLANQLFRLLFNGLERP